MNNTDAFGVDAAAHAALEQDLASDPGTPEPPARAAGPLEKSWIERNIYAVIGGVIAFFLVMALVAVVVNGRSRGNEQRAAEAQRRAQLAEDARSGAAGRAELEAMQSQVQQLQLQVKALMDQQAKGLTDQDLQGVRQEIADLRKAQTNAVSEVAAAMKVVADQQPFEAEMYIRDDAEIVSVGNGVARVRDRSGAETSLRKGDKWAGLRVMRIRADRRQVTLSDGSVIL